MPERKPFLLRLPADLHDELRAWADADLRSLNGQLEFLLRDAVRRRGGGTRTSARRRSGPAPGDGDGDGGGGDGGRDGGAADIDD